MKTIDSLEHLAWELYYVVADIVCPEPDIDDTPYVHCQYCGDELPWDCSYCGCEREQEALTS